MEPTHAAGIAGFMTQTDCGGRAALLVLLVMSVTTWYLIVTKAIKWFATRRRSERFLVTFWDAPSVQAVAAHLEEHHPVEPFSHLAWHGIVAARQHQHYGANK